MFRDKAYRAQYASAEKVSATNLLSRQNLPGQNVSGQNVSADKTYRWNKGINSAKVSGALLQYVSFKSISARGNLSAAHRGKSYTSMSF